MYHPYEKELIRIAKSKNEETIAVVTFEGDIIEIPNISNTPKENFKFSIRHLTGLNILFIFHSHVSDDQPGRLSFADIESSKKNRYPFVVYHKIFDEWDVFDPRNVDPYPLLQNNLRLINGYLNWIYQWGRCDCYTLVRAFYSEMMGIKLDDFSRGAEEDIISVKWNRFAENFAKQGFYQVEDVQKGDLILLNIFGNPNGHHVAIYLGDLKILHLLCENRPSEIRQIDSYHSKRIISKWRHKDVSQITW